MLSAIVNIDFEQMKPLNNEGLNSQVYTFYDKQLGGEFIAKKVAKSMIYADYKSNDPDNLFAESNILYRVKHPNIMEIQYAGYDDENIYMIMPKYEKGSIQSILNKRFLTVREILKYSLEFLSGLHYIHTYGLIHFDIKPTNILINNNGKAVLTDFGLAKYAEDYGMATPNKLYGSITPPEACKGEKLSNKADIYQAGITMYRMCINASLWNQQCNSKCDVDNVINGTFPDRKFYLPHIPNKLKRIINKCMAVNPDDRYETVLDIINDISSIGDNIEWEYQVDASEKQVWRRLNKKETHYECIVFVRDGEKYKVYGEKVKYQINQCLK
nr:serine/threonine-protein kinase [uncultured Lachnoclostridium sp.]